MRLMFQLYYRRLQPLLPQVMTLAVLMEAWIGRWSDAGPTYFLSQEMNPQEVRQLPGLLQPVSEDDIRWLFLHFPADQTDYVMLLLPVVIVVLLSCSLRYLPRNNVSRAVVKFFLLFLGGRYFYWRTLATVNNQTHPLSTLFSCGVWVVELVAFCSFVLYTLQTIRTTTEQRRKESRNYVDDHYRPTVDIFIPTHNEQEYIVRRTVMGCQAINYDNKTIYVLNDYPSSRPEIHAMTEELGCHYIAYPDNRDRKAGNLNHALWDKRTQGELIAVLDADFVPYANFLARTVGFFRRSSDIDMVQTPQDFYNPDYHARNLNLGHFLPNDMEHFYGLLQPNRDAWKSVICCGSSYVVRRKSLEEIGGYYTQCCVEDFQTSLRLLINGKEIVYLNEILSQGESPRSFADFINQRLRWLQGNVQVYFRGDDLPIWSKLNWVQKSFMVSLALYCIHPIIRVVFLLTPLLSIYSGIAPVLAPFNEVCYYFLPFWLLLAAVYGWASDYRVNYFWNECYETVFCFPALVRLCKMAWGRSFKDFGPRATDKGTNRTSGGFEYVHVTLISLLGGTVVILLVRYVGLYIGWWPQLNDHTVPLLSWLGYNFVIISVAVLSASDIKDGRQRDRFPLEAPCTITVNSTQYQGYTTYISESGALLKLDWAINLQPGDKATLALMDKDFKAKVFETETEVCRLSRRRSMALALKFESLKTEQHRRLVQLLYATGDHWWKQRKQPGLTDSALAIFATLLGFRMPLSTPHPKTMPK